MSHPVYSEALLANAVREHPELSCRALVNHCCAKLALCQAGTLADRRAMSRGEIRVPRRMGTSSSRPASPRGRFLGTTRIVFCGRRPRLLTWRSGTGRRGTPSGAAGLPGHTDEEESQEAA